MVETYHESEARTYGELYPGVDPSKAHRLLCPKCYSHKQGEVSKVLDCKNLFADDNGNVVGQCCCYSEVHGKRSVD